MAKDYAVTLLMLVQANLDSAVRSLASDKVFEAERSIVAAESFLQTAVDSLKATEAKTPATGWYV